MLLCILASVSAQFFACALMRKSHNSSEYPICFKSGLVNPFCMRLTRSVIRCSPTLRGNANTSAKDILFSILNGVVQCLRIKAMQVLGNSVMVEVIEPLAAVCVAPVACSRSFPTDCSANTSVWFIPMSKTSAPTTSAKHVSIFFCSSFILFQVLRSSVSTPLFFASTGQANAPCPEISPVPRHLLRCRAFPTRCRAFPTRLPRRPRSSMRVSRHG